MHYDHARANHVFHFLGVSNDLLIFCCCGGCYLSSLTGTLNRRGQDPQDFQVVYKGGASGTAGHLIIQTEEEKFSFELVVP